MNSVGEFIRWYRLKKEDLSQSLWGHKIGHTKYYISKLENDAFVLPEKFLRIHVVPNLTIPEKEVLYRAINNSVKQRLEPDKYSQNNEDEKTA